MRSESYNMKTKNYNKNIIKYKDFIKAKAFFQVKID